jgi:hypothetical protein
MILVRMEGEHVDGAAVYVDGPGGEVPLPVMVATLRRLAVLEDRSEFLAAAEEIETRTITRLETECDEASTECERLRLVVTAWTEAENKARAEADGLREAASRVSEELTGKGFYGDECEVCMDSGFPTDKPKDDNGVTHEPNCALVKLRALLSDTGGTDGDAT